MQEQYPFEVKPLPYPYQALEPYIDAETVRIHHDKHYKGYVDKLNAALAGYPVYQKFSLERLLKNIGALPPELRTAVKNNGGGVYNHELYFSVMQRPQGQAPMGRLKAAIDREFGGYDQFRKKFSKNALDQFGSGYAWLASTSDGRILIKNTANQDTLLPLSYCPILLIDVWEHAYYLKYRNQRAEYVDGWFSLINWKEAEENYEACIKNRPE